MTLQAGDSLTVGGSVQFSGVGKTFGADGNEIKSDWSISGNPIHSSAQGTIRGRVYADANHNGAYDEGEGLADTAVTLTGPSVRTASQAETDDNGIYTFCGLTDSGPYTVTISNPDAERYYFADDEFAKPVAFAAGQIIAGADFVLEEYQEVTFRLDSENASINGKTPAAGQSAEEKIKVRYNASIDETEGASVPDVIPVPGSSYVFTGWQLAGAAENPISTKDAALKAVTSDLTYVAVVSDAEKPYTIQYYYDGQQLTGEKPDESFAAKTGDTIDVTEDMKAAGALSGYVFHYAEPSDALIISGTGSNIIKLYYLSDPGDEPGPDTWQYTVKYLEQHTNHELHAEKVVSGKALYETVTEEAVSIAGYDTAGPASVTITIEAGDNEIVFYYTVRQYAVSFNANGGSAVAGQTVNHGGTAARPANPTRSGYTFTNWNLGTAAYNFDSPVTRDITLIAQWRRNGGTDGGTGSTGGGGNTTPPTTTIPDTQTPLDPSTTIIDQEVPLAGAVGLNDTDHFAYVIGYDEDHVRPLANITRAEAATIFFRLMTDDFRQANWATTNSFTDVKEGAWYNNAVSTCAKAGILAGYEDGSFKPNANITRAEFAAIAARFPDDSRVDDGKGDFSDTADHWAASYIRLAAKAGWINGNGNRFDPEDFIIRAQVMTIVNRMLDRTPDKDHMLPEMKKWADNPEDAWYYEAVQEAANNGVPASKTAAESETPDGV